MPECFILKLHAFECYTFTFVLYGNDINHEISMYLEHLHSIWYLAFHTKWYLVYLEKQLLEQLCCVLLCRTGELPHPDWKMVILVITMATCIVTYIVIYGDAL